MSIHKYIIFLAIAGTGEARSLSLQKGRSSVLLQGSLLYCTARNLTSVWVAGGGGVVVCSGQVVVWLYSDCSGWPAAGAAAVATGPTP